MTLATGVCGTHAWWGEKRQRDARDSFSWKSYRVSREVVRVCTSIEYDNKTYDDIVIGSLYRISLVKPKRRYSSLL